MARNTVYAALFTLIQLATSVTYTYPAETELAKQLGCTPLRILCVGDSITKGSLSSSGDGFRGYLQSMLVNSTSGAAYGADVDFVGQLRDGKMTDNSHDGKSGAYLADLVSFVQPALTVQPNVVFIHAGTNDMDKNVNFSTAIDRLEAVVRATHDGAPNATIFLAQLISSKRADQQNRTDIFNPQIPGLVGKLKAEPNNFSIVDVNMSRILNNTELGDPKHPNDTGYFLMAKAWYDAIANATTAGMLAEPEKPKSATGALGLGLQNMLMQPNITCKSYVAPSTSASPSQTSTSSAAPSTTSSPASQGAAMSASLQLSAISLVLAAFFAAVG